MGPFANLNCFKSVTFFRDLKTRWKKTPTEQEPDQKVELQSAPPNPRRSSLNNGANLNLERPPRPHPPKIEVRQATIVEPSTSRRNAPVTPLSKKELTPATTPRRLSEASSLSHPALRSRASSNGSTVENSLKDRLRRARVECPRRPHSFFVPKNILEELITVPAVQRDILAKDDEIGELRAQDHATEACRYAKQLYAVLAYVKKGPDIYSLLSEGITDEALPMIRSQNDQGQGLFALFQKPGDQEGTEDEDTADKKPAGDLKNQSLTLRPIPTFERWTESEREKFDRIQWWMTAATFEDMGHYDLDEKKILPFVRFSNSENIKPSQGAYSEVYPVRVHPAHHDFWTTGPEVDEPLVAIKKLFSPEESEFEKERTILKTLGMKAPPHPHLIKLLASYRHKQKYHFMFPYADANLRKYWEDRKHPTFDAATVLWSMKQMTGLADALYRIHMFRVTIPLEPKGGKRVQKDVEMSVRPGEELFGRHGDIKPENILWFQSTPEVSDPNGVLQIADFGLGRFHGRDSRSRVNPDTLVTSPTYEPPECKLHRPVSRAYDLWSMGCVYLEFITWLLRGAAGIDEFADFRGEISPNGIDDDNFFTIIRDSVTVPEATIRQAVVVWVEQLHQHEKCSQLIHNVLDLIMKNLLQIETKARCQARFLHQQMKMYLGEAEKSSDYMLKPTVHAKDRNASGRSQSTSNVLGPPKPIPQRHLSGNQEILALGPLPTIPRSAIYKPVGGPATKKVKSVTWPIKTTIGEDG